MEFKTSILVRTIMHPPALKNAAYFISKYLNPLSPLKILDVGSFNVNGSLRPLFTWRGAFCSYCGHVATVPENDSPKKCQQWDCYSTELPKFNQCCNGEKTVELPVKVIGREWKYFGLEPESACLPYGDLKDYNKKRYNVDIISKDPHQFPIKDDEFDVIVSSSCFEHDDLFWITFKEMVRVTKNNGYIYLNVPSSGPYHGYPGDCWRFYKDSFKALALWCREAELVEQFIDEESGSWKDNIGIFKVRK